MNTEITIINDISLTRWAFMWTITLALFAGFKWLTWWRAGVCNLRSRSLGYLFLWPGMDVRAFLDLSDRAAPAKALDWVAVATKTGFGAGLFWGVARIVPVELSLLRGWIGLIGLVFVLHFGVMHGLALAWRVKPIMRAPMCARSLSEFWGKRWNVAFQQLAAPLWFEPVRKRFGSNAATVAVFAISGLLHELAISVPTGAGYGLPMLYFLAQGIGVCVERRGGFARGWRGWLWMLTVTAGPAFWLFHPPFVTRVIVPFMEAVGAL